MTRASVRLLGPCFKTGHKSDSKWWSHWHRLPHDPNTLRQSKYTQKSLSRSNATQRTAASHRSAAKLSWVKYSAVTFTSYNTPAEAWATFSRRFWRIFNSSHYRHVKSALKHCYLNWISHSFQKLLRLHLNGFTYLFTLSSKFFSTFPHGTCLLSVSYLYLALDGVYHQLWAAFPNNSTLSLRFGLLCSSIWASHLLWVDTFKCT